MMLKIATEKHLLEMADWFDSEAALMQWGGPDMRFPFTLSSLVEDCKLHELHSYVLLSSDGQLRAFGQFYARLGYCHLGRLAVHPQNRGQGVVATLIALLSEKGQHELGYSAQSLFVLENNVGARRAYDRLGFICRDYPALMPIDACLYMVRSDPPENG